MALVATGAVIYQKKRRGEGSQTEMRYESYPSAQDQSLQLFAGFHLPQVPSPLAIYMHGWHGSVKDGSRDKIRQLVMGIEDTYLWVEPEMRGRGKSAGTPDANGWELQDVIDAVQFAQRQYPDHSQHPDIVYLLGGSGGGGNVYSLIGKFPDFFSAAVCFCGISDYAAWYEEDQVGEFRDELEVWIGGDPGSRQEAYASRSGITLVENLLTPLLIVHGTGDLRVPVEQADQYMRRAARAGKESLVELVELQGVGSQDHLEHLSQQQQTWLQAMISKHLRSHNSRPQLPLAGRFIVAGYLQTRCFGIIFDDIDRVGRVEYTLSENGCVKDLYVESDQAHGVTVTIPAHLALPSIKVGGSIQAVRFCRRQ
ncbi:MAG: prolyl oligopeptidase family serine peptidase [Firmicutes bacterium]|nr:prolyl oligopeptidase family serine peptidase [Bacillota bacterium]